MNELIQTSEDKLNLDAILKLKEQNKKSWSSNLSKSKKLRYLLDWLNSKTPLLQDKKYSTSTKLYWVVNGIVDYPNCKYCENGKCPLNYDVKQYRNIDSFELGYFRACCSKCPNMQKQKQRKLEKTCIEKYGSANYFSSSEGKKKKQAWCEQQGVKNPFQLEAIKEKSKQTRKKNFGFEFTMQSPEKRKIASNNYKEKTGYTHQFKNPNIIEKVRNVIFEKKQSGIDIYAKRRTTNRKQRYLKFLDNNEIYPNFSLDDFLKLDSQTQYTTLLSWHCKKCNTDFDAFIDQNFSSRNDIPVRCMHCHPINIGTSKPEKELFEFIQTIDEDAKHNYRKLIFPYEVDIYSKKHKIAIEFDGLYWHSDETKIDKNYHLMKTALCEKQGIQLIHVFEDEWINKQDIVKSRLRNLLGIYDKIVYARKCQIKIVDSKTSKEFQEENHIQGAVNSKVNLGLYFEDELVSLMTFGKCRFDKNHEWELLRFCNKLGYHIPGGASKLLKFFERSYNPKSLVSYADRRWSQGKVYEKLGFTFVNASSPNYWYLDKTFSKRLSRIQFQKHKLKNLLEKFDENKTEVENMLDNGYNRIFDCGNLVYYKSYL